MQIEHEPSVSYIICAVACVDYGNSAISTFWQQQAAKQQTHKIIGDSAIKITATTTIQMLMAYNTMYTVNTAISAPLGFVQANPTIPKITVRKLRNLIFDSKKDNHGLSARTEFEINDEFMR